MVQPQSSLGYEPLWKTAFMTKITEPCKQSATMEPSSNNIPFIQLRPPPRTLFKNCPFSTHVPSLSQDPTYAKTLLSYPFSHTLPIPHIHNFLRNCPSPTYLDSHHEHPEQHQTTATTLRKRSPLPAKFTPCMRPLPSSITTNKRNSRDLVERQRN